MEESTEQFVGPGLSPYPDAGVATNDGEKLELTLNVKAGSGKLSRVLVKTESDQLIKIELTWERTVGDVGAAPSTAGGGHEQAGDGTA